MKFERHVERLEHELAMAQQQLTLSVHRERKPARIAVTVTETPARWVDIDAEGNSGAAR